MQTNSGDNGWRKDDGVRPVPCVAVDVASDGHTLSRSLRHYLGKTNFSQKPSCIVVLLIPVAAFRQIRGFLLPLTCEESWHALRKQDGFHHVSNFNHNTTTGENDQFSPRPFCSNPNVFCRLFLYLCKRENLLFVDARNFTCDRTNSCVTFYFVCWNI